MLQAQACVFLLLRSGEADGGSTCSSINAQQGDGSNLVAQGVEALGGAALGGELQDILSALVSVLGQGQHNAVAVSQAVSSQLLALVLRAGNVQVQVGDVLAGGCCRQCYSAASELAASELAASELAASEEVAAEEATEEAVVEEAEPPQAVIPTASARAAATTATFLSFIV